jgi:FlaG/FlaF family flagellin (archaellin)
MAATVCPDTSKFIVTTHMATKALYAAWGTGGAPNTPSSTTTTLFTEASETRVQVVSTVTSSGGPISSDTHRMTASIQANGSKTITNAGVFDSTPSGGKLYIVGNFATTIPVQINDIINFVFLVAYA